MASFVYNSAEFPPLNSAELTRTASEQTQTQQQTFSAAAAPTSAQSNPPDSEKFFLAGSNQKSIGTINTINGRPTITFSDVETQSLAADFRYALVGNSRTEALHIVNYIVSFPIRHQRSIHCLPMRVFKWSPTFIPDQESSIVPVWVSFPDLPAHLFRKDALHTIAKFVGVPLQIADSTFSRSMLSRARVCIEIDLLKPLVKEFDLHINGTTFVQKVEFEQVPQYCSLCKHVGHHDLECYTKGNAPKPPPRAKQTKHKTMVQNSTEKGKCSKTPEIIVNDEPTIVGNDGNDDNDENVESTFVGNDTSIVDENAIVETLVEENAFVEIFVEENIIVESIVEEIDDANVNVNEETGMHAIVERDANLVDNVGKNGFYVANANLSVGAHLSIYSIINAFERWEKRPKRLKLKEAVQLFKNLKHLGRVCPGARYCKNTFERGSRFVEAIAKVSSAVV
ncbi:UNVERIFIED_CONTAM: hypothetical protein Sradi_3677500 [Sesamum radiatum]|uniref:DUF4283 domain-containing protein n=1 Tax=Sesamum radiatum TaxID=300843 RepID=A0AAW2QIY1_SESRA